jgi:type I restriction enzyme S subunit
LPEYFVTYLNSPRGRAEIDTKSKQSVSQANINSTELRELDFELPSMPRQREIVERAHSVRKRIEDMLSATERSDEIMTELPQSVLNDAFQGELINYSPESGTEIEGEGQTSLGEF